MKPLKQAVRDKVNAEKLTPEELGELNALQSQVLSQAKNRGPSKAPIYVAACLAFICLGLVVGGLNWRSQPADINLRIAQEVSQNHLKLKPLDVETTSIQGIQNYFSQLAFMPQKPSLDQLASAGTATMQGGRYCSVQGITAAQLRYRTQSADELTSVYQVAYDQAIHGPQPNIDKGETPRLISVRGLSVSLWQEQGLLMVLVSASPNSAAN